ncbi:DUF2807 domain-containing protein [Gramella sp. GC03-9]|uniref:DUF2807 domain-containing protein n=1 Tax=Christiangramia oceanisediminis TaxID=2920386 RepID=A0A9X2KYW1_9FLAO|nr:head GIN domain-containing protein [Gramella oceanisediminis]MCP9200736.1 DUF2807 domain-containing protein [Gramella oceanisediminis]
MKRSILILAALLITTTSVNAQWWGSEKVKGNGKMVTESRSTDSYDEVKLVGSFNVELVSGKEGNLKVEAESNLQEYIITEVNNGVLKITTDKDVNLNPTKEVKITVPFESLSKLSVTGSGDMWNRDLLKGSNLKVEVTGSGDMVLNLDVQDLEGVVTGSGDIELQGRSQNFECKVTGSGDFKAYELEAENVKASVAGSGDIRVNAKSSLKASVAGSGDINYKGNPEKQDFQTYGSGRVSSN